MSMAAATASLPTSENKRLSQARGAQLLGPGDMQPAPHVISYSEDGESVVKLGGKAAGGQTSPDGERAWGGERSLEAEDDNAVLPGAQQQGQQSQCGADGDEEEVREGGGGGGEVGDGGHYCHYNRVEHKQQLMAEGDDQSMLQSSYQEFVGGGAIS